MLAAKIALTLVILPLGDSITDGVPTADGYRGHLRADLAAAGITAEYVGSRRSPAGAHEGWSGYTTDELIPPLRGTLAKARPDVVLLHIGTNDLGMGVPVDRAVGHVRQMLVMIDERSRKEPARKPIRVFLAAIIGRDLPGDDDEVVAYNRRLAALAAERSKAGQPVTLVDVHGAVDRRKDLADALHPSDGGYRKIARAWATALRAAYAR